MVKRRHGAVCRPFLAAACLLLLALVSAPAARADRPGAFDYYVLSLSWSPSYCAAEGGAHSVLQRMLRLCCALAAVDAALPLFAELRLPCHLGQTHCL